MVWEINNNIQKILEWGKEQSGINIQISVDEVKDKSLDWVDKLFPKNAYQQESYIANGPVDEIKTKYIMYHCLMELWTVFNNPQESQREYVFNKVMLGKENGWEGCENASIELVQDISYVSSIDYYLRFDKKMFDCIGI